jgi:uncharacterized protein
MADRVAGPFAVVTGASTGFGYCLARIFGQNGFDVLCTADEPRIDETASEIESFGGVAYPVQADLSKEAEVERLWSEIESIGPPVDAIALNAGIGTAGDFAEETDLKRELSIIDLDVRSTVHLAKLAARQMVERGSGRILITASIAGTMLRPTWLYMARPRHSISSSPRACVTS